MKKKLTVPFIPSLDEISLEDVNHTLEGKAPKQSIEHVNWSKEFPYAPITEFFVARSEKYLYVSYSVHGNCLRAVNSTNNSPVWEDSCVEFFAQIPGKSGYYNFEINCIGTCLAAGRESRESATHFSDEQISRIRRFASAGTKPFHELQGMFHWVVTVAIPFDLLGLDGQHLPEKIYANFYKCADASSLPHYLSWSPINLPKPNFHCPEFFGELYF